jgi:hypothetical protein
MRVWLDCEFNEFRGDLISMALVAEDGQEWYCVLPCPNPGQWVAEHVIPVLGQKPVERPTFSRSLRLWMKPYSTIHVIADWPEDIAHFCESLIVSPGESISVPSLTMELRRDLDLITSAVPHNALADARALRASHLEREAFARRSVTQT